MLEHSVVIGTSSSGAAEAQVRVSVVLGSRSLLGATWAAALAQPSPGHVPFIVCVAPGVPVKPVTLFVSQSPVATAHQRELTEGAAHAGVAAAIGDVVADGTLSAVQADTLLAIVAVHLDSSASDADTTYRHARSAAKDAVIGALQSRPSLSDSLAARDVAANELYTPPHVR